MTLLPLFAEVCIRCRSDIAQFFRPSLMGIVSAIRAQLLSASEPVNVSIHKDDHCRLLMRGSLRSSSGASQPALGSSPICRMS